MLEPLVEGSSNGTIGADVSATALSFCEINGTGWLIGYKGGQQCLFMHHRHIAQLSNGTSSFQRRCPSRK